MKLQKNMSKLAAGIAISLMAGVSTTNVAFAAEDFQIKGAPQGLSSGCSFLNIQDGAMSWNEENRTWTTTQDAQIRVKTREVNSVAITNDGKLRDQAGAVDTPEVIDYSESTVSTENARNAGVIFPSVTDDAYTVGDLSGGNVLNIKVDHRVVPTDSFVALNDVNYHVQNTATCTL
jgi:hypothetical protein